MKYRTLVETCESYRKLLDELEMNVFECDGELWYPVQLVQKFLAAELKFAEFVKKSSHTDVRAKIHYLKGVSPAPVWPIACEADALYPDYQRCRNC